MNKRKFRILDEKEIKTRITMSDAIGCMRDAFVQISKRDANVPVRTSIDTSDREGRVLFMPAYSPSFDLFSLKMVSVFPNNKLKDHPVIHAKILAMDAASGVPIGLLDAEYVTALRTGAASGLATDLLAPHDSAILAIFGTGAQAKTQVEGILAVRKITKILVYGSTKEKAVSFCNSLTAQHHIEAIPGEKEMLKEADILCTATTSSKPVFEDAWLKPGVHINGIGSYRPDSREIPAATIQKAIVVVDHFESALAEAGDLILPMKGGIVSPNHVHAELGELLTGLKSGRTSPLQTTIFKSVGNAVQDLAIASFLLKE
jgi:ornithine cyclodeaminase/alanine dehydrogenase-like protein (mu-crystallin family)